MKKGLALLISLALLLSASVGVAEGEALTIDQLGGMAWMFSSGAGGWSTELYTAEDGSFTGTYHDSEMGEAAEEYPNGTVYYSAFSGHLSLVARADENSWRVRLDSLTLEDAPGQESIDDGFRFVATEPYGVTEGDELLLFLPGTPVEALTEDMRMWAHVLYADPMPTALEDWFLYSEKNESGFVGYATEEATEIANPWTDMTPEALEQASGLSFGMPEGAEDVVYRWLESEGLAEMQFVLDGDEYCARIRPAALEAGQLEDISGMYFEWENVEEVTIGHCRGTIGQAQAGSEDYVELCLWYDAAPGLMYSLSVHTTELDGLDLTAVAGMVYVPAQGED